jgi:hypothetical protein
MNREPTKAEKHAMAKANTKAKEKSVAWVKGK